MKTRPIEAADVVFGADEPPRSPRYGDVYRPRSADALDQARHVFLAGNDLPRRWQGRERFVILETGFGLGHNLLATWQAWREDPLRCRRLHLVSIDRHPPTREALARAHAGGTASALVEALLAVWPPATANLHPLSLEGGALQLLLAWGDVDPLLAHLELQADAVFLDGFAPARNPQMWSPQVLATLGRQVAPGATLSTWSVARSVRDGLTSAGFVVERRPGFGGKREMCVAQHRPRPTVRPRPRRQPVGEPGHALVVGAGLAGAFAADALARAGWRCTVLERHAAPAREASGNPGGLFHATVHGDDGVHARFTRAAAWLAARRYRPLVADGRVAGRVEGLLRLHPGPLSHHDGLPPDVVRRVDANQAARLTGLDGQAVLGEADFFPDGGWIDPGALCRALLAHPDVRLASGRAVVALETDGAAWIARLADGSRSERAAVVVLATGAAGPLDTLPSGVIDWPQPVRGQISWLPADAAGASGLPRGPRLPLAGQGYALTLGDGRLLFGSSTHEGDPDPTLRPADQRGNLERLHALLGRAAPAGDAGLPDGGRVGWRAVTRDRLPLVGAWPQPLGDERSGAPDQCRRVPRVPGLFILGGLGSRGLTWGPLAGEILAAWVCGSPMPVESDLLDAVDPARARVRATRLARRPGAPSSGPDGVAVGAQATTPLPGTGGGAPSVPPA